MAEKITKVPGGVVESWYDRRTRSWITQLKDPQGNQVGESTYSGDRSGMEFDHRMMVKEHSQYRGSLRRGVNFEDLWDDPGEPTRLASGALLQDVERVIRALKNAKSFESWYEFTGTEIFAAFKSFTELATRRFKTYVPRGPESAARHLAKILRYAEGAALRDPGSAGVPARALISRDVCEVILDKAQDLRADLMLAIAEAQPAQVQEVSAALSWFDVLPWNK